uniref:Uncharacterized protein n=1 Tax=Chromera velia CCMP2878 TaxID=1169474 RepID=A0A0G4FN05_9ALVE|eukprot:Cvel_17762.t1-p1 / transcript=Cvel_17762.t1 / gene=Cvel_17762 / organism=Chromera_velia_CCMP2878 / gene_product=hypothetical protein / transcript_product=hypothetical protein / location=Cvel_scaffold1436:14816-16681(-) / protein_length=257 / sequence_SO=supercontig / SO=protein_coding / is_pseudo=false
MQKRSASSHVDGQGAVEAADNLSEGWNDTDIADEAEHDTAFAHLGLRHLGNPSSCSAARSERVILRERGREEGKGVSLAGQVHKRDSFDPSRKAMMLRQITPGPSIRRADPHQIRTSTTDSGRSDEEDVFLENFESLQIGKAVERLLKENSHSSSQATGSGRSPHFPSTIPSLVAGEEWKALMQSVSQGDRRAERRQHASFSSKAAEQGGDCLASHCERYKRLLSPIPYSLSPVSLGGASSLAPPLIPLYSLALPSV